jgi:hypothetical protein
MNMSHKFMIFCAVFGAVLIICGIVHALILAEGLNTKKEEAGIKKRLKLFFIFGLITVMISIFLPDKETCIEMMVASQITHENVEATKEEVYEIIDYITDKIKEE